MGKKEIEKVPYSENKATIDGFLAKIDELVASGPRGKCIELESKAIRAKGTEDENSVVASCKEEVASLLDSLKTTEEDIAGLFNELWKVLKETTIPHKDIGALQKSLQDRIDALRLDGVAKKENLKNENTNIRKNKQLEKSVKNKILKSNKISIKEADIVRKYNCAHVKLLYKTVRVLMTTNYKDYYVALKVIKAEKTAVYKDEYKTKVAELNAKYQEDKAKEDSAYETKLAEAQAKIEQAVGEEAKELANRELKTVKQNHLNAGKDLKLSLETGKNDANVRFKESVQKLKDEMHSFQLEKFNAIELANNRKLPLDLKYAYKAENYKYQFNLGKFFLSNGLYIAIVVLLIFAVILYAIQNGAFLFNLSTIRTILNQVSPKMFLALGVAGLILLAGTDLSVGRLVGLASVLTGMLVTTSGTTSVTFFGVSPDFSAIPFGLRVVLGFLLSIVACVAITSIAGFFTAKFKMHPFVSTLATQLFTFGMLAGITGNTFTGSPDPDLKEAITGYIPGTNFPIMILWALLAIIIVWFIWNKTTFGKNMYAVGGNPEAASVSGISVFWITMGVFIMAGILYGLGGSIYGIYTGNVRAQTGQGMETDAIAACVVGGVSFSGGVGKISGVVIGAILFQTITVVLQYIGVTDSNYQLAIKGLIVLVAVALDCAKYLRKK